MASPVSAKEATLLYRIARHVAENSDLERAIPLCCAELERNGFTDPLFTWKGWHGDSPYLPAHEFVRRRGTPFFQGGFSKDKLVPLRLGQSLLTVSAGADEERVVLSVITAGTADRDELNHSVKLLEAVVELLVSTLFTRCQQRSSISTLKRENESLRSSLHLLEEAGRSDQIFGDSPAMRLVYRAVAQVAESSATVLILGETGTGKELVARAIHAKSPRSDAPFVPINCGALPDSLLEAELFGYEKGSFTGALSKRTGRFEQANGGTLFLDEIGEMSLDAQTRLLRVIQERSVQPIGSDEIRPVDVRIICATNRNLEEDMASGRFREDLYYRINIFPIPLPPLRDRPEDLLILADKLLHRHAVRHGKKTPMLTGDAVDLLRGWHWPGNVRELENAMERAVLVAQDGQVTPADLPSPISQRSATPNHRVSLVNGSLAEQLDQLERGLIALALEECKGNQSAAARLLKTTKRVVQYAVKRHSL